MRYLIMFLLTLTSCKSFKESIPVERPENLNPMTNELQQIADWSVNEFELPGVQIGFMKRGENPVIVSSGNFDFAHKKTYIENHHSFRIGSTTKMFVAALFCRFAEEGKLELNDTLAKWLPDYPQASNITISDLLNHTSGIDESLFKNVGFVLKSMLNHKKRWDPLEIVDVF
ncbi:MAG: serine hydrolase [Spirochaetaceae bacterium]|nr:serine hydrolase [Spirochaetaceae bacterium]